jgi:hypothetical protein
MAAAEVGELIASKSDQKLKTCALSIRGRERGAADAARSIRLSRFGTGGYARDPR